MYGCHLSDVWMLFGGCHLSDVWMLLVRYIYIWRSLLCVMHGCHLSDVWMLFGGCMAVTYEMYGYVTFCVMYGCHSSDTYGCHFLCDVWMPLVSCMDVTCEICGRHLRMDVTCQIYFLDFTYVGILFLLQLLLGAPEDRLTQMRLTRDPTRYHFVSQGGDAKVRNIQ